MADSWNLKLIQYKEPNADWQSTLTGGYLNIEGKVNPMTRYRDPDYIRDTNGNPTKDTANNGYWKVSAELTGLINPFTVPGTTTVVNETKIEVAFEGTEAWGKMMDYNSFSKYLAASAAEMIEDRYKKIFGVQIKLKPIFVKGEETKPAETKPADTIAGTPSTTTTTTEVGPATSGASASDAAGATAVSLDGEFTFNIEQENQFIGNNQFGTLFIVGIGEIKDESVDKPVEETMPDEALDEEFQESEYKGIEELDPEISAAPQFSAMQIINDAEASRDTTEADKTFKPTGETISGKLNTTPDKGKGFGIIGKKMADKDLLKAMVDYIEGGYYYPGHAYSQFNESSRKLYGASGETLWGIDRHAGQTENSSLGKKFWAAVDNLSGYGSTTGKTGYAKKTNTRSWDSGSYPTKSGAWKYNYMPSKKDAGFDTMYNSFVEYATDHCHEWLDKYFKDHPVKAMILSDARMKFMWFRATWNGPGWFSWYVNGKKGSAASTGLKWAYDNVSKNADDLILWDLNNRLKFGNTLITHDVKKIAKLIGIKG